MRFRLRVEFAATAAFSGVAFGGLVVEYRRMKAELFFFGVRSTR